VSDIDKAIEASLKTMDDVESSRLAAAETASRREFEAQKQMEDVLRVTYIHTYIHTYRSG
jgi:hypothetical protein